MWRKFDGEQIKEPIKEAVENAIKREAALGNKLKVCIGTDSQVHGLNIELATVIVFLREQKGGFMFIQNSTLKMKMKIKMKMNTVPSNNGKSLSLTAVKSASYPMPGHENTVSITNAPFNQPENRRSIDVNGAMRAFRRACLKITFRHGTPLARASFTNSESRTSSIEDRVKRIRPAAAGQPRATHGSM